eukprot:TRINITY_DN5856_c0_g1_i2.p4 TRINITY_DN5856_c0_g1~~TRINITY_DN5856_c0_g1_i2.p4  ORF type:complete len:153 (+),score=55.50 TRINITY_DN5856_c0_g1_i2:562-1020(+)
MRGKLGLSAKDEPLYKKMEEKYNKEVVMPSLEMKKKELALKRNRLKPVSIEEIEEHTRKHEELAALREEERKNLQKEKHKEELEILNQLNKYRTPTIEKMNQFEEELHEEQEKKKVGKKAQKRKNGQLLKICKRIVSSPAERGEKHGATEKN